MLLLRQGQNLDNLVLRTLRSLNDLDPKEALPADHVLELPARPVRYIRIEGYRPLIGVSHFGGGEREVKSTTSAPVFNSSHDHISRSPYMVSFSWMESKRARCVPGCKIMFLRIFIINLLPRASSPAAQGHR